MDEDDMAIPGWEEKQTMMKSPLETKADLIKVAKRPASMSLGDLRTTTRLSIDTERKPVHKARRVFSDITQRGKVKAEVAAKVDTWRKRRERRRNEMCFAQFMQETMR